MMQLKNPTAEIYVPDGTSVETALRRTTHMAIGAHQDDLEIMAYRGILECFGRADQWYLGVVVTNGAGSPRTGLYADYSDEQMQKVRRLEQKKAAFVGEFTAVALMDYTSAAVKAPQNRDVVEDLRALFFAARPEVVYTHNLADKHDTHIGVALRVIEALRGVPEDVRPKQVLGCEVWRDLDWMTDSDKVALDVAGHENLAVALLGVFDSQICGGKRYDLATMGRRRSHATYWASHGVDESTAITFAMDMTPLIQHTGLDVQAYIQGYLSRFAEEVHTRISRMGGSQYVWECGRT